MVCAMHQSAQMALFHVYITVMLTQLKAYRMLEFSWMVLDAYGRGA